MARHGFFSGLILGVIVGGAVAVAAALIHPLAPAGPGPDPRAVEAPSAPDTDAVAPEPPRAARAPAAPAGASGRLIGDNRPAPLVALDPVRPEAEDPAPGSPSLVPLEPGRR